MTGEATAPKRSTHAGSGPVRFAKTRNGIALARYVSDAPTATTQAMYANSLSTSEHLPCLVR